MITTTRFTADNTEGYIAEQLAELNRRYEEQAASLIRANVTEIAEAPAWWMKSELDRIAEGTLRDFDSVI